MRSRSSRRSLAALRRFGVRLVAIGVFATLWPHQPIGSGVALVSVIMAAVCALAAAINREPVRGSELSRRP